MDRNTNGALRPGTILKSPHGEYVIIKILGQGGFGITYLVESKVKVGNIEVKVNLAVKEHFISSMCSRESDSQMVQFSQPVAATVEKSLNSFIKEARRVQELGVESPNIIKFNEVFEANNTAYYVMEYLNGVTLEQFVLRRGRLSAEEAETLLAPIANAVSILHSKNLTHYDIKPQNIIITTNEEGLLRPVLIDFGLSKHYDNGGTATSMIDMVGFSRGYAPVEQYYGLSEFTPEADVYALGATLYFCLTGKNPEDAAFFHPQEKLAEAGVSIPSKMKKGMLHALNMSKRDRPKDAGIFAKETFSSKQKDFERSSTATQVANAATQIWMGAQKGDGTVVAHPDSYNYAAPPSGGSSNSVTITTTPPKSNRKRLYIILGIVGVLLLGGAVTWIALGSREAYDKKKLPDVRVTEGLAMAMNKYDEVRSFHDGLAAVIIRNDQSSDEFSYYEYGKYGYINTNGEEVVPCVHDFNIYGHDLDFHEGLAPMMVGEKYGYIDTTGKMVIPAVYEAAYSFSDGLGMVAEMVNDRYRYFFIDKEGKEVVSLAGEIYIEGDGGMYYFGFTDGMMRIYQNEKWGFMNKEGQLVVPCVYDEVEEFSEGLAAVRIGDLWGYIDKSGKQVISIQYQYAYNFSEGMAGVKQNERYGFIDKEGNMVVQPIYQSVGTFHDGLATIETGSYPKYSKGYIDKKGQIVIPMTYGSAGDFSEGLAKVGGRKNPDDTYVTVFGFINLKDELVIPMIYTSAQEFSDGLALVEVNDGDKTRYGFVDRYGTSTFDLQKVASFNTNP